MYCKKCGQQINEGAVFCGNCGAKIIGSPVEENNKGSSAKKAGKVFLTVIVVALFVGGGIGAVLFLRDTKKADENFSEEVLEQPEKKTEMGNSLLIDEEELVKNEQNTIQLQTEENTENAEDDYAVFGITKGVAESYESALNTNDYQYYNSGIENFRFFYPATLYSDVFYNEQEAETPYGINIKAISFVGSAGSELLFSLSRYADGVSIEEISEKIYNLEKSGLIDAADVIYGTYEDHGRIIVTGYEGEDLKPVYDLFYVDSEYVMQMKIIFTAYQGIEDKLQKAYVTECMYRLCGFSGSTANCRSYETFKAEIMDLEAEIAQIKEQYYAAQDRLDNMEIVSEGDITVYIEDGNVCKIVVAKGTGGIDYAREYSFENGRLYFAFVYDGGSERRFYFVDDMLVRYINERSEIYDLEDADFYMQFASQYQNEAYEYRNVYLGE